MSALQFLSGHNLIYNRDKEEILLTCDDHIWPIIQKVKLADGSRVKLCTKLRKIYIHFQESGGNFSCYLFDAQSLIKNPITRFAAVEGLDLKEIDSSLVTENWALYLSKIERKLLHFIFVDFKRSGQLYGCTLALEEGFGVQVDTEMWLSGDHVCLNIYDESAELLQQMYFKMVYDTLSLNGLAMVQLKERMQISDSDLALIRKESM